MLDYDVMRLYCDMCIVVHSKQTYPALKINHSMSARVYIATLISHCHVFKIASFKEEFENWEIQDFTVKLEGCTRNLANPLQNN